MSGSALLKKTLAFKVRMQSEGQDRLHSLVVKASNWRSEGPGFNQTVHRNISPYVRLDPPGADTDPSVCGRDSGHVYTLDTIASSAPEIACLLEIPHQDGVLGGVLAE